MKRREIKAGHQEPHGFILEEHDQTTGKKMGWVEVGNGNEDRYFMEAYNALPDRIEGTYELLGPKVQGNPEGAKSHFMVLHGDAQLVIDPEPARDFNSLKEWLSGKDMEGIVFHHKDGRAAKIKLRDFGLKR